MLPRSSPLPPALLLILLASLALCACVEASSTPAERRAVVLTLDEAPDWAKTGATVEVRDEQHHMLLAKPLEGPTPVVVDVEVEPTVRRLEVAVRAAGREAKAEAVIDRGYATCKLH